MGKPELKPEAASQYTKLEARRTLILERAKRCAKVTVPTLLTDERGDILQDVPWSSLGARGVNNLANRLTNTLFPPNTPFFRLSASAEAMAYLSEATGLSEAELDAKLSDTEREAIERFERSNARTILYDLMRHLLVTGNGLLHIRNEGYKVFPLTQYVVERDGRDNLMTIVIKEKVNIMLLPEQVQEELRRKGTTEGDVDIYTHVKRVQPDKFVEYQQVSDIILQDTVAEHKADLLPYLPARWNPITNSPYGAGLCFDLLGDLEGNEAIKKALTAFAEVASKIIVMVRPNGTTKAKTLAKAKNGDVITGDANDVTVFGLEKYADFNVAASVLEHTKQELSWSFMLNSVLQRKGDRVTAEEIQRLAEEIEASLGGAYSMMSQELQRPIAGQLINQNSTLRQLRGLGFSPVVSTGLDAIGRNQEFRRLNEWLLWSRQASAKLDMYLKDYDVLVAGGQALGVTARKYLRSEDEVQQAMQQQAQAQLATTLAEKATPELVKGGMNG